MTYDEYMALAGDLLGWTTDEVYHRRFRSLEALRVLTLTEQLLGVERSGLPVPGEFSDQRLNAAYLEQRGAAIELANDRLADLEPIITRLLDDDAERRRMAGAMLGLARPEAAARLADLMEAMAA